MKRLAFSLLCSAIIYLGYVISVAILYLTLKFNVQTLAKVSTPLKAPDYILFNLLQLERVNHLDLRGIILLVIYIAINLFIFSIPFYLAFTLYSRIRRKPKMKATEVPPNPPNFESSENH